MSAACQIHVHVFSLCFEYDHIKTPDAESPQTRNHCSSGLAKSWEDSNDIEFWASPSHIGSDSDMMFQ